MTALICGSFAYDTIMVFPRTLSRTTSCPISVHILNVSFLVPDMRREVRRLRRQHRLQPEAARRRRRCIMATVGDDFAPYASWLAKLRHRRQRTSARSPDDFTAQAYITTDLDDNQITAFHPGAMNHSHENRVQRRARHQARHRVARRPRRHAAARRAVRRGGHPFMFDPGQGLPMFNGEELRRFVEQADYVAVNDYEARCCSERTICRSSRSRRACRR